MDDDTNIAIIDRQLKEIKEQMEILIDLKRKLTKDKEKLLDKKNFIKSEERAKKSLLEWSSETHSWSKTVREKLNTFGFTEFRTSQLETINATMAKLDLIFVAPTGGGKSLTYQLPALCEPGITIVISPLISLMEDQLYALRKKKIPAEMLSAQSSKEDVKRIHNILEDPNSLASNNMKLLYITPERITKSKRFMQALQKCYQHNNLQRIAIDEVHCCSIMGHDFRPDYKKLFCFKALFPTTPLLCVTATASRKVIIDVQKILDIRECLIFNSPFFRPNLYYHVLEKPSDSTDVYNLLSKLLLDRFKGQSGIIYTFSIKDTDTLVSELLQRNCQVRPYHAQLQTDQRSDIYKSWMNGRIQAVVATIAFGLGIDKPDVRFVIHHTMSKSMENFYQESGRCGRDGNYAENILLYRIADMFKISSLAFNEVDGLKNVYSMVNYAINSRKCRRDQFAKYFTEVWDDKSCSKMCDCCYYKNASKIIIPPKMNILPHYQDILKILEKANYQNTKMTALKLIEAWYQKGLKNLRIDAAAPNFDRYYGEQIIAYLILNDYLREDFHFTAYAAISYIVRGHNIPTDSGEIEYHPSRNYDLPPIKDLASFYERMKADTNSSSAKLSKRKLSESKSGEHPHSSKSRFLFRQKDSSSDDDDDDDVDDVILIEPKKENKDVISID